MAMETAGREWRTVVCHGCTATLGHPRRDWILAARAAHLDQGAQPAGCRHVDCVGLVVLGEQPRAASGCGAGVHRQKLTHRRSTGVSDLTAHEFKAWTRNVWNIPVGSVSRDLDHPCKFPTELPRRLIKLYSYVGDVVLDPFCGSGTTLRVAKDLARRAIGVDISGRYCAMSGDRCRQQLLFAADVPGVAQIDWTDPAVYDGPPC